MSQENVERVRTAFDAYNREGPEAIIALLDPNIEWIADRSDMGRVTYRGRDGVRKSLRSCTRASIAWALSWTS
jgi:ketosteroid isomerase-like protein